MTKWRHAIEGMMPNDERDAALEARMANDPKYQASLAMWREKARILEASAWVDQNDPPPDNGGFSIARMIRGGGP